MDDTHPNGMDAKILYCMETSQMPGQQSDYLIVVMKPVKAGGAKGVKNSCFLCQKQKITREVTIMQNEMQKIRYQSENFDKVQGVMHYVNADSLREAHKRQKKGKAKGIDGIGKDAYGENLDENISDLLVRMKRFQYKPKPVRRVYIPKGNGKYRPLGIPSYEDRLVQSVMADILNATYEPRFLDCSYGFRPGRSAHDVVRVVENAIDSGEIHWVLEADIKGFFDHVDHKQLMEFLRQDIDDSDYLRYIARFLKSGVMEEEQVVYNEEGTPQGGLISPVLANVYLHYVLDDWIENTVRPLMHGKMCYVRYADDFLILFQLEDDARRVMGVLPKRLGRYGLELAADKTRIFPFDRNGGSKENFDFLGFTFYMGKTRGGRIRVKVRSSKKKLKNKRSELRIWLDRNLKTPVRELMEKLNAKLRGHEGYYAVNGNYRSVLGFWYYAQWRTHAMLNRRGGKRRLTWEKFGKIWNFHIPNPRIRVQIW